ncbi:MAG: hypothetical protein JXR77_07675 [Lentisphaeria bacterium]|nr:hypothetical protein [Lentisphaeria bacterium]
MRYAARIPHFVLASTLLITIAARELRAAEAANSAEEARLTAVLKGDAGRKEKADACRELVRVGGPAAVPALSALLGDTELAHMARYALEPIDSPAVDAAFRDALGRLQGLPLVGVIGSVGMRRDAEAVPVLGKHLAAPDPMVAAAAARSLGRIGGIAAATLLEEAVPRAADAWRLDLYEGICRCAESLAKEGQTQRAIALYDRLRALDPAPPHQVRTAALRGAILLRGEAGLPLLLDALRGPDKPLVAAAARTAIEMPGTTVTTALANALEALTPDTQVLVCLALGVRHDPAAMTALAALARKGETASRVAAVRAMPEIGAPAAVRLLLTLHDDAERQVAEAARDALAGMAGGETDAALLGMLADGDAATRFLAIELLGQRRVTAAIPGLLKAAVSDEERNRLASLKVLRDLAGPQEFPALLRLLLANPPPAQLRGAEDALAAICVREARPEPGAVVIRKAVYGDLPDGKQKDVTDRVAAMVKAGSLTIDASNSNFGDPVQGTVKSLRVEYAVEGRVGVLSARENDSVTILAGATPRALVDALCEALKGAAPEPTVALLRVLRAARGDKALATVRAATGDPREAVREEAVSILCGWQGTEVLPDLLALVRTPPNPKAAILALRGCFRLIPLEDAPPARKVAALDEVLALCTRPEERRLGIAALQSMPSPEALARVLPFLEDAALKEEACLAVLSVAAAMEGSHPDAVKAALQRVADSSGNKDTARRARDLLAKIGKGK